MFIFSCKITLVSESISTDLAKAKPIISMEALAPNLPQIENDGTLFKKPLPPAHFKRYKAINNLIARSSGRVTVEHEEKENEDDNMEEGEIFQNEEGEEEFEEGEDEIQEEEDVDSDGEIDEELEAVVRELERKRIEKLKIECAAPAAKEEQFSEAANNPTEAPTTQGYWTPQLVSANAATTPLINVPNDGWDMSSASVFRSITINEKKFFSFVNLRVKLQLFYKNSKRRENPAPLQRILDVKDYMTEEMKKSDGRSLIDLAESILKEMGQMKVGETIDANIFNTHFFLVQIKVPNGATYVRDLNRCHDRIPVLDPPIMYEMVENEKVSPHTGPHPRADKYPPGFSYAMIEYCEDPYWMHPLIVQSSGIKAPTRPSDHEEQMRELFTVPPFDSDPEQVPGVSVIPIPQEALDLQYARRDAFRREQAAAAAENDNAGLDGEEHDD
ncbi:hypothetical protein L3Y34_013116 [Caenorhabditis briggsae]|uniref:Uncharacterized protein n=1 Tax=Caenorhabditis briggsae TaxID=6238 RepID=A0AAE9CXG3_CAEBR|nr:hypothetical protein L3Y34_013116 [Caenorhabditis briggsae]